MAWTRKSSAPQVRPISLNMASTEVTSSTSHGTTMSEPTDAASGFTRLPSASP